MLQLTIIGNLGSNANEHTAKNGGKFITFSVAVSQRGDIPTLWFDCRYYTEAALTQYLTKGRRVCVCGDFRVEVYNNQSRLKLDVYNIEFCGERPQEDTQTTATQTKTEQQQ